MNLVTSISQKAVNSLIQEPCVSPHYGLVGPNNNGSHSDMNYKLFIRSALSLEEYFTEIQFLTLKNYLCHDEMLFDWRQIGMQAEYKMLQATNGINTHRGCIFLHGLYILAYSNLKRYSSDVDFHKVLDFISENYSQLFKDELCFNNNRLSQTYGEWAFKKYKLGGARSTIYNNFKNLRYVLNLLKKGLINLSDVRTYFLAYSEDTNLVKRAGIDNYYKIRRYAQNIINRTANTSWNILEEYMLSNEYSAAAAGDMTALTIFIWSLHCD